MRFCRQIHQSSRIGGGGGQANFGNARIFTGFWTATPPQSWWAEKRWRALGLERWSTRGRERADQYLSLLSGSQEKEVGKQKICSMIRREIQLPGQLILRVSRSWRYCNGRPTNFESEPILAVLQCQANLTKKCAVPDHIWPFGHRKRIFGGLSVSFWRLTSVILWHWHGGHFWGSWATGNKKLKSYVSRKNRYNR